MPKFILLMIGHHPPFSCVRPLPISYQKCALYLSNRESDRRCKKLADSLNSWKLFRVAVDCKCSRLRIELHGVNNLELWEYKQAAPASAPSAIDTLARASCSNLIPIRERFRRLYDEYEPKPLFLSLAQLRRGRRIKKANARDGS